MSAIAVPYSLHTLSFQYPVADWRWISSLRIAGIPFGPVFSATNPHRLRRIILTVEIVVVSPSPLDLAAGMAQIGDPVTHFLTVVLAGALSATTPAADRGNALALPESMYRKPPSEFCDCFTYRMHASTVSLGTYSPAFRAARKALI